MSWIDDIQKTFSITTGDGTTYYPEWKGATKDIDYNVSVFEFVNVDGSLVVRKAPKGRKFDLNFYFDGEDATTQGNNFEISAQNQKYWTVEHPLYGSILCHPLSLKQDDTFLNSCGFTCQIVETQMTDVSAAKPVLSDIVEENKNISDASFQDLFLANEISKPSMSSDLTLIGKAMAWYMKGSESLREFQNQINSEVNLLQSLASTPLQIITQMQNVINYPAKINDVIFNRATMLYSALTALGTNLGVITGLTKQQKTQYECNAGTIISALFLAAVTDANYETRNDVITIQELLTTAWEEYLGTLEDCQSERSDTTGAYMPNFENMDLLESIVNTVINGLWLELYSTKQERIYVCKEDTNLVLLTHRFYGMDIDDANIDNFIAINNIGINEMLSIKKGREIKYYV